MENKENLDLLIKEYSGMLMKTYGKRSPLLKDDTQPAFAEKVSIEETVISEPEKTEEAPTDTDEALSDTASFYATVRSGEGAFPVPDAKVLIRKESNIISFLVTDENGNTPHISLPAYSESDSLSSETAKEVMYFADIIADGFQTKRNLPVAATGGAEIVLNVELTPDEERVE